MYLQKICATIVKIGAEKLWKTAHGCTPAKMKLFESNSLHIDMNH